MIRSVGIRGFKRFDEVEFRLPGHVVLAGPNNTGKTTVLQAIASWSLALRRWRELNDFRLRRGLTYGRAPIARQAFSAVPLRSFDLLWTDRKLAYWQGAFPPDVVKAPLNDHEYLIEAKARTRLIPPLLDAAGLYGLPYTRYHEIAALMRPEEIHPEVVEKLDAICRAFGVEP